MHLAHPEVAIVTQNPDDPLMVSLVSQFLENEVFLHSGEKHNLLPGLPANLESFKAIAFDPPSFQAAMKDEGSRQRLVAYASKDGFLLCMKPIPGCDPRDFNVMLMNDHLTFTQAHDLILSAGLMRFNPALRHAQLARSDDQILAEIKPRILKSVEMWEGWHEFNLYYWKAAQRLIESGHEEARIALIAGIRNASKNIPSALNHDYMAGYFAAAWLCDQTGERAPLEKIIANADEVLVRRPRSMGVITSCGFEDDPLGLKNKSSDGLENFYDTNWNTGRHLLWTEGMLMYGPAYAALARVTGDKRYRDEVEKLLTHLERHHVRPDGLLWHCTREGQPGGGLWGRGQTHALLGILFVMDELQPNDPLHARCAEFIRRVGRALLPHQDTATGMWRNLINAPLSRLESSGTTLFATIFARGVNQGWLDRTEFEPSVRRAWDGIKTRYWRGKVAGWCRGTAAAVDDAYYLMRPQGGSSGASTPQLLWLLLEVMRLSGEGRHFQDPSARKISAQTT